MTPEQHAELRKPFPAKTIGKLPKGGAQLDFVGHAAVTDRLLAVDPGWTWEPFAVDEHGFPAYQNGCLWIRLTVCGVTRIGVGDGPDPKQRIGDAVRNAAMRFGVALDLWSKTELESIDPNGGDNLRPVAQQHASQPDRKAARGVPADDQWRDEVVTDQAWMRSWTDRLERTTTDGEMRGLWGEAVEQGKAGLIADEDMNALKAIYLGTAQRRPDGSLPNRRSHA